MERHYDTHNVFVLQAGGRKRWRLFGAQVERPLEVVPRLDTESEASAERRARTTRARQVAGAIEDEFVLEAGNLLHHPRGDWHEAETAPDAMSLHLAVGLRPGRRRRTRGCGRDAARGVRKNRRTMWTIANTETKARHLICYDLMRRCKWI